jgi:hypothetical protein
MRATSQRLPSESDSMRKVFGFLFGNWFARPYLMLVAILALVLRRGQVRGARSAVSRPASS